MRDFGAERIVVGIDAREGMTATHGWVEQSQVSAIDLAKQMHERGVERIVYTDIARDGMLQGIDADAMAKLARKANVRIIASGGVASLNDIQALRAAKKSKSVIVGQALYTGAVSLKEIIKLPRANQVHRLYGIGKNDLSIAQSIYAIDRFDFVGRLIWKISILVYCLAGYPRCSLSASHFSASISAIVPKPAETTACRKT